MPGDRRANRGPGAAGANRSALLTAAREVFARRGLDAPLSAVARRAGVGQGSLYRHFPDRVSLALAVFDENLDALERAAAHPDATLAGLLAALTEQVVASTAFIDLLAGASDDARLAEPARRVRAALGPALAAAREAGTVRPDIDLDDLLVAIAMVAGAVAGAPPDRRRTVARRAWELIGLG
ncbi:helix-turn-helix domain-containing protein [Pseudonocardia humida]|uniref:Helix-turn-helix transcriptional regulator n=1 Tax=Pseudonocardia humida TaxID=2800819 RepID=A0ABT1AC85_9PSEU|nr:helix-turn-helix domain-containing protein [Pseudonocardia humida]MCO1660652.1 helix-turn-helix transcriptional regulator [Pseudonocardia humida]